LLEQLPAGRVTYVVRGGAIINDALPSDAEELGIAEFAEVIDNGDDAPGTLLEHCTPELGRRFAEADLVIAKGQGNFETLNDVPDKPDLLFLFRLKCDMVCRALQREKGLPMVLWRDELDAVDGKTLRPLSTCD
ncbi:MAG: ARMT1-like domain-containing protein, partial [Phycisphaerae bacterium]